jgi:hypothetical protein
MYLREGRPDDYNIAMVKGDVAFTNCVKEFLARGYVILGVECSTSTGGLLFYAEDEKKVYCLKADIHTNSDEHHFVTVSVHRTDSKYAERVVPSKYWELVSTQDYE